MSWYNQPDPKITPKGPTPSELTNFDKSNNALLGGYTWHDIRRDEAIVTFQIQNKYLTLAGLDWLDFRAEIKRMFRNKSRVPYILGQIKNYMLSGIVPVRTGRLVDVMMLTAVIKKRDRNSTNYVTSLEYEWSAKRPLPINGRVQHNIPETGYGDNYLPSHTIPNRHPIRKSKSGNSTLYYLDDPRSFNDPNELIIQMALNLFHWDFVNNFNTLKIILNIP